MAERKDTCPKCAAPVNLATKFCGKCGERIASKKKGTHFGFADIAPTESTAPGDEPSQLSEGPTEVSSARPDSFLEAATVASNRTEELAKTELAGPAPEPITKDALDVPTIVEQKPTPVVDPKPEPVSTPSGVTRGRRGGFGKTVFGLGSSAMTPISEPERTPVPPADLRSRTKLGMPSVEKPVAKGGEGARSAPLAASNRTMLGMPLNASAVVAAAKAQRAVAQGAAPKPLANKNLANRTMLGVSGAPSASQATADPGGSRAPGRRARKMAGYPDEAASQITAPRQSSVLPWILAVIFLLGLLGASVAAAVFLLSDDFHIATTVAQEDGQDILEVRVDEASPGTEVELRGETQPLESGRARFRLSSDTLTLGNNELTVRVLVPGSEPREKTVSVVVNYRVRADVSGFADDTPTFAVVVEAIPGSQATLDGTALEFADGVGRRAFDLPVRPESAAFEHSAAYSISLPDGSERAGELETRIGYAALQLDRPGLRLVTEQDDVEIAGAVHEGASVTVDGNDVPVNSGRFLMRYPVPLGSSGAAQTHSPLLVVRQEGHAPHILRPVVRRVADLATEARSFDYDRQITYARLRTHVETYVGQRVALEGRVYNVDIQNGQSVLQILARTCPRASQCPAWITYPAATESEVNDWVRVLGTVAGEQQFRSETDQVYRVPRIDAAFILPLAR